MSVTATAARCFAGVPPDKAKEAMEGNLARQLSRISNEVCFRE
jgi:hypothetical protein